MLRKIRLVMAIVFCAAVTLLFLDFTGGVHAYLGWMAKVQFVPAVLSLNVIVLVSLLVMTLLLGRVYCSVICPMGVFQDFVSWVAGKRKKYRFSYSEAKSVLRYVMLVLYAVVCVLGVGSLMVLLDPYAAYGRMASAMLQPLYMLCNNAMAFIAERVDSYRFYEVDIWMRGGAVLGIAVFTFIIIGVLAWRNGRTYCNTICPVGTLLGAVSRFSFMKITVDESKCNGCGLCERSCKSSCINAKEHKIDYSRCVACMDCIEKCNKKAISFTHSSVCESGSGVSSDGVDVSKRAFVATSAIMAASAAVKAQEKVTDGGLAVIEDKEVPDREGRIVPAGAVSVKSFLDHCTGCQLCVSVCPNGVLRPSTRGGLLHIGQPEMSYERGYCRPECTRCSEVCPAGAINLIDRVDKSSTQIGHAVWIKKNCVVLTDGVECGNCARHCPSGAITMLEAEGCDGRKVPIVDENRCIGCGACENLCPSRPFSAIYVEGHEVHKTI